MEESDSLDVQGLYNIIEEWWKSCYHQAEGNVIDMISFANGMLPIDVGEEMRVHFKEKTYIIKRTEDC